MASFNPDELCWDYMDPKGAKQGPFSSSMMGSWYAHKMLPGDLKVRCSNDMEFQPISKLFPAGKAAFSYKPQPPQPPKPPAEVTWQYRDTKGVVQGPFSSVQMRLWYEHSMLPKDLPLRRQGETAFGSIPEFFPPPLEAFKSAPVFAKKAPAAAGPTVAPAAAAETKKQTQPAQADGKSQKKEKAATPEVVEAPEGDQKGKKGAGKAAKGAGPIGAPANTKQSKKEKAEVANATQQWSGGWQWTEWDGWTWSEQWDGQGQGWSGTEWQGNGRKSEKGGAEWQGKDGQNNGQSGKGEKNALLGMKWGPQATVLLDLLPEEPERRICDEGIVWDERWISPLAIRFSQHSVHPFFHGRGPITEVLAQIQVTSDPDGADKFRRIQPPFPPIRVLHIKQQGVLVTLDNRRLYALQHIALQEWPNVTLVKALVVDELTPQRLRSENRKFTSRVGGLQVEVESRSSAFDTFSWVTEAAKKEAPSFCRPITFHGTEKLLSLLPALVVHTLLSPRIRKLIQSRLPLLKLSAKMLRDPLKIAFPGRHFLLQHVFELARPQRSTRTCPSIWLETKQETVVNLSKGKSVVSQRLSVTRPLTISQTPQEMAPVQQDMVMALLPLFCMPYARAALKGSTRDWVLAMLITWGKIAMHTLKLPARKVEA